MQKVKKNKIVNINEFRFAVVLDRAFNTQAAGLFPDNYTAGLEMKRLNKMCKYNAYVVVELED